MKIPKFRFFGKVNDRTMRMIDVDSIDFKNGHIYYEYRHFTAEGDSHIYGDVIGFEDGILMQSTGLKDRNGVEIFEGDIMKDGDEDVGVVVYDNECGAYGLKYKSNFILTFENIDELGDWKGSAVIGNIWENKEFLEEK